MAYPRDWSNVRDNIVNPDVFLEWIRDNLNTNRLTKYFQCGEIISTGQAIMVGTDGKAYLFNINNPDHEFKYAGVAETSGDPNIIIRAVTHGVLDIPVVTGSPYYVSTTSFLQTTAPVSGLVRFVGVAVDTQRLLLMPPDGSGGSTPSGDNNIDGGFANSIYLTPQLIDGGGA